MNYIGIDIGGTNLKAGLVNDEGSILAMEKRKIAEISDQLGFGSPRYFSRCFKAQFNITPADYRKTEDKQS